MIEWFSSATAFRSGWQNGLEEKLADVAEEPVYVFQAHHKKGVSIRCGECGNGTRRRGEVG